MIVRGISASAKNKTGASHLLTIWKTGKNNCVPSLFSLHCTIRNMVICSDFTPVPVLSPALPFTLVLRTIWISPPGRLRTVRPDNGNHACIWKISTPSSSAQGPPA